MMASQTGDLLPALPKVIVGDGLQIVDVVEIDVVQEIDGGINVARHGDVNQKKRPVLARLHQRLQAGAVQDAMRGGGAADEDVNARKLLRPILEADGAARPIRSASSTARSWERLETRMPRAPRLNKARAVFSPVSPAPMIMTG